MRRHRDERPHGLHQPFASLNEDARRTPHRAPGRRSAPYAERITIHPKSVSGRFRQIKWAVLVISCLHYYLPWVRWNRGPGVPDQAVLVDMANRRLYFFWIEIWPQEIYYLTGLLILAAFGLFLVTSLFGRVWCGYRLPADRLDRSFHVGRAADRRRPRRPHPPRQTAADLIEAAQRRRPSTQLGS